MPLGFFLILFIISNIDVEESSVVKQVELTVFLPTNNAKIFGMDGESLSLKNLWLSKQILSLEGQFNMQI